MGDLVSEYFEDLSLLLDTKVYDQFVLYDKPEVGNDMLKLGSAKKIICNEFETQIICHEKQSPDTVSQMEELKWKVTNKLSNGCFRSNYDPIHSHH